MISQFTVSCIAVSIDLDQAGPTPVHYVDSLRRTVYGGLLHRSHCRQAFFPAHLATVSPEYTIVLQTLLFIF